MDYKTIIETDLGVYKLSLITNDNVYYVNDKEFDANGVVIMFDKNNKIISENYFAYTAYVDDLEAILYENKDYSFVRDGVLEEAKEYFEEYN